MKEKLEELLEEMNERMEYYIKRLDDPHYKDMQGTFIGHYLEIKDIKESIKKIQEIKAIEKPTINITCKIDWYRNNTWGYCPKGEYWSDFGYSYIGGVTGCGYDKTSTWTAKAFNKDKFLKAYISHFVEKKHITRKNIREKLGYGIHIYNGQISFDGGVGISSHIEILKNLGFRVDYQSGKTWDALRITKK